MNLKPPTGATRSRYRRTLAVAAAVMLSATLGTVTAQAANADVALARVANPFAGGTAYVNADWAANAQASGGSAIANQPTCV